MKITRIATGIDVSPVLWALREHPELWNKNPERTESPDSPHHEVDDIWIRYGDAERVKDGLPHDSMWYPGAEILGVKNMCLDLMRGVSGVELGGVLITRIPAGKCVKPHTDPGWHAQRYEKFAIQLASAPGQVFTVEDESLETKPGDVFWFRNDVLHWVNNPTPYERVTMIVCIRKEP